MFRNILMLYRLADEVIEATQLAHITNRDEQVALAIPYVTQIKYSTDIMYALYKEVVFNGRAITREMQDTFEKANRNVFEAFEDLLDGAEATLITPDEIDPRATEVTGILSFELPDRSEAGESS